MQELFDEGYVYDGEMRPRGIKILPGYWPADAILERLPKTDKDVYLVLTLMDLKGGEFGRINGKGCNRAAIATIDGYTTGYKSKIFNPDDVDFNDLVFSEIGHALGLLHHRHNPFNPCPMSHNEVSYRLDRHKLSLEDIHFCDECYKQIK